MHTMLLSFGGLFYGLIACILLCLQISHVYGGAVSCIDKDGDHNNCNVEDYTHHIDATTKWNWEPTASHPCNIQRISHRTLHSLFGDGGLPNLYPYPLVIYTDNDDKEGDKMEQQMKFRNLTTIDNLPLNFAPEFQVTLTGSDSLSTNRRTIPLKQYLRETVHANNGSGTTLPDKLGNETWYLFGETFTNEWSTFLESYSLPPCVSCTPIHRIQKLVALSFGIGNIGSGVQWHLHGPGFSETIHGKKHWVLYPPEHRPEYDINYASRHWMEHTYPKLNDWTDDDVQIEKKGHVEFYKRWTIDKRTSRKKDNAFVGIAGSTDKEASGKKPWECTINEGELIYFPDQWHHATINLDKYTVFVSSFTTEHE